MAVVVDVYIERLTDGMYGVYLLDPPYREVALWHIDVHWPLTGVDRREIEWACTQLGADACVVSRQVRDAIREAAKRPAKQHQTQVRDSSTGRRFQQRAG